MMNKDTTNASNEPFKLKGKHLILVIIAVIIISIGILASTIYLFISPGVTSWIIFGLAVLLLLVIPLILAIVFYNKKLKNTEDIKPEKKTITLRSSDKI